MILAAAGRLMAQDPAPADTAAAARSVRVFFDCNADCDDDFIRTQTPWVSFVRDRVDADVHLLITSLGTGAGGEEYTLNFVGLGAFAALNDTLRFVTNPNDTDDEERRGLTRLMQLGLAPFAARTAIGTRIRMVLDEEEDSGSPAAAEADPWNSWVFEIDANGSMDEEQRQSEFEWGASLDARRVTDRWKVGTSVDLSQQETRFTLDSDDGSPPTDIVNIRKSYSGGAVLVRSLGPRWGAGAQVSLSSSTFSNTEFALRAAPAIEYSIFPYDEFTRRQLTLQYSIGVSSFRYREQTIFGRFRETRPTHAILVGFDANQRWGSADLSVETARYLDDVSQWRLEVDGEMDMRLLRGLSIEIGGSASLIRDQLGIAARSATPEEILLELRDLQTDYRYDLRFGISYTFGSIFSAVVNPRFGTGPGQILP
jgi:hypothetical protein